MAKSPNKVKARFGSKTKVLKTMQTIGLMAYAILSGNNALSQETGKEIRDIKKSYETEYNDTIYNEKTGEVKKITTTTEQEYDYIPLMLSDDGISGDPEDPRNRLHPYAGFIQLSGPVTLKEIVNKFDIPTQREANAVLEAERLKDVIKQMNKDDVIILIADYYQGNEAWIHKETKIPGILAKNHNIQENYKKIVSPRPEEESTKIIERRKRKYDTCTVYMIDHNGDVMIQGAREVGETTFQGKIYILQTSPTTVY